MLVIGGCELSLERNPLDSIEIIDFSNKQLSLFPKKLAIPARGATAHLIGTKLWVLGGCRGPKDHLKEVQILDLENSEKGFDTPPSLKLNKERSCHMSAFSEKHN